MSSMMELLLKILLLCLTVVIKVVFTGVASFAMHGSCSHRNAREHGSSFPLLDFVFYWFVRTAQGVYVLTLVALTKIATCNSILSWHWQSSRTCDSTHQFSIWGACSNSRNSSLVLELLGTVRACEHHIVLLYLLILKIDSRGAIVAPWQHIYFANIILENTLLTIFLNHFVVVFHFTILARRVHAVTMWRLELLTMDVGQALFATITV